MAGGAHGMVAGLIAINSLRNSFAEQLFQKPFSPIRNPETRINKIVSGNDFSKQFFQNQIPRLNKKNSLVIKQFLRNQQFSPAINFCRRIKQIEILL